MRSEPAGSDNKSMKVDSWKCDECSTEKGRTNHWWKAYKLNGVAGVFIVSWDVSAVSEKLELSTDGEAHLCGAACVSKWVSENLL